MTKSLVVIKAARSFFDSELVLSELKAGERAALGKAGSYVRGVARRSMRNQPNPNKFSQPGKPPFAKKGQLKKLLFFSYDPQTRSVVVGPEAFGEAQAPAALEFGGTVTARRRKRIGKPGKPGKPQRVDIAARPFMEPALETSKQNIPDAFAGILAKRR